MDIFDIIKQFSQETNSEILRFQAQLIYYFYKSFYSVGVTLGMNSFYTCFMHKLKEFEKSQVSFPEILEFWQDFAKNLNAIFPEITKINPKVLALADKVFDEVNKDNKS